jgi:hypothetical protein
VTPVTLCQKIQHKYRSENKVSFGKTFLAPDAKSMTPDAKSVAPGAKKYNKKLARKIKLALVRHFWHPMPNR